MGDRAASDVDYLAIGHVTVDVILDGPGGPRRQPGGGALYSALQAARLGLRASILTAGCPGELEPLLERYRDELTIEIVPAPESTTLATRHGGTQREQRLLAWAGVVPPTSRALAPEVLHLAPVARELARAYPYASRFVGLTPQGLIRTWLRVGEHIEAIPLPGESLPPRCDAAVLSAAELPFCAPLLERRGHAGSPIVATTAGPEATTLLLHDGSSEQVVPIPIDSVRDDLGAGDVFAAAFFVELARGSSPAAAARFGNAAAVARLSGIGPDAIGDRAKIEALLAERAS